MPIFDIMMFYKWQRGSSSAWKIFILCLSSIWFWLIFKVSRRMPTSYYISWRSNYAIAELPTAPEILLLLTSSEQRYLYWPRVMLSTINYRSEPLMLVLDRLRTWMREYPAWKTAASLLQNSDPNLFGCAPSVDPRSMCVMFSLNRSIWNTETAHLLERPF